MAARRFGVPLAFIFKAGYDYGEVRKHPKNKSEAFGHYINTRECPTCVFDFALDLLAGRTTMKKPEEHTL